MQYNFRGKYSSTTAYVKKDVVSYQPTPNDPIKYYFCLTDNVSQLPNPNGDTQYWAVINTLSNFPNSVDTFIGHTSLQASDKANLQRFQELSLKTTLTPAEQDELSTLTQNLRDKLILPEDFNALQQAISNLQMFFKDNVEGYINQKQDEFQSQIDKFTDRGEYNSTTTYYKNNFVTYQGQTYICTVDGTINIPPTNISNWRLVAAKGERGEQGLPGLNLVYKGTYDPTKQYNTGDAVEYGGSIYYATQNSIGETPQSNGTSWTIFMPRASILVSPTVPSSPTDKQVWVDSSNNIFKFYNAASSSWVELNANDAKTLGGQTLSQIQTDYNNKIGNLSNLQTTDKDSLVDAVNEIKQEQVSHSADNVSHVPYAVATGLANTYAVTLNPAPAAYTDGMAISVKINVDSTGASTLNVNGLGAKPLKKANGNDVTNLKANGVYTFRYNASTGNFILQGEGGSGNAQPSDVLSGKTFTNDAGEQVGTMVNRGAMIITPTTSDQPIPQGYHNGSGVVKGDPDLIPANIKKGVNIFGAVGTLSPFHTVPDGSIGFAANIIDKNVIGYDYYYDKNTGNFIKLTASLGNYIEKKIYDKNGTLLSTQNIGSFPSMTWVAGKNKNGIFVSTTSNVYLINDNGTILKSAAINGNIIVDNIVYDSANDVYVGIGVFSYSSKAVLINFTGTILKSTNAIGFNSKTILTILQDGVIHGVCITSSSTIYQFVFIKNGALWDFADFTISQVAYSPVFLSHLVRLYGGMEK